MATVCGYLAEMRIAPEGARRSVLRHAARVFGEVEEPTRQCTRTSLLPRCHADAANKEIDDRRDSGTKNKQTQKHLATVPPTSELLCCEWRSVW